MIDTLYVLRTCRADGTSRNGFRWPETGPVEAPDWDSNPQRARGGGLHGLPWGIGDAGWLSWAPYARWQVVRVDLAAGCIGSGDKCRFRRGEVVFSGDRKGATDTIIALGANPALVPGAVVTGGDWAVVTGGDRAVVTGGYRATVIGGYRATVIGGYRATVSGGNYAVVTGGDYATVSGGNYATVTGGDRAVVTGGDYATVTGGDWATVTGGDYATVSGGNYAPVSGGNYAVVTGGVGAVLIGHWWDGTRRRIAVAYVGEDGIEPGVPYRVVDGKFVRAERATP